jgi:hypothetical protein
MYIGATLDEVRDAIRTGKIRNAVRPRNPDVFETYDVRVDPPRGAGTRWLAGMRDPGPGRREGEALTGPLASKLVPRWWRGGPGTKLVVGFRIETNATWSLTPVVVTRPATPRTSIYRGTGYKRIPIDERMTGAKIRNIFMEAFHRAEGYIRWNSPLYVWPAGILDTRTSNAANKTVGALYKAVRERRELVKTKDRVAPVIERYRANLIRRTTQRTTRHANLMAELRAVPKGALHPSFPGGSNYVASIARLEAIRREFERNKKKRKRANATNRNPRPKKRRRIA